MLVYAFFYAFCLLWMNFASTIPTIAASKTPVLLAAKSSHSPLRRPPVQYSWSSSSSPLISIGATTASNAMRFQLRFVCRRRYSIHIVRHVPPYITKCVHLSMNGTPSNPKAGMKGESDSIHIKSMYMELTG